MVHEMIFGFLSVSTIDSIVMGSVCIFMEFDGMMVEIIAVSFFSFLRSYTDFACFQQYLPGCMFQDFVRRMILRLNVLRSLI